MKIKTTIAALFGVLAINGAVAGTAWCPPDKGGKCIIEDCPDIGGSISVGYDTDYLFYGIRVARDNFWGDVSYTFDGLPLTLSVWHLSSLGSGAPAADAYGDETDLTASFALPSIMGIDASFGYRAMIYANSRTPNGSAGPRFGDSQNEIFLDLSKDLMFGLTAGYRVAYDFNIRDFDIGVANQDLSGSWMHIASLSKSIGITDNLAVDLSGGVFYSDNYWQRATYGGSNLGRDTGWQNYFIQAALPIALNCRATLTPYIGYNGTPDGWVGDGLYGIGSPAGQNTGANANDLFHGGVNIQVNF